MRFGPTSRLASDLVAPTGASECAFAKGLWVLRGSGRGPLDRPTRVGRGSAAPKPGQGVLSEMLVADAGAHF